MTVVGRFFLETVVAEVWLMEEKMRIYISKRWLYPDARPNGASNLYIKFTNEPIGKTEWHIETEEGRESCSRERTRRESVYRIYKGGGGVAVQYKK
jgi:hypothetical protein